MPTNLEKYFGAPEKAAKVIADPKEMSRMLRDMADGSDAAFGMALACDIIDKQVKERAMREWLESEADRGHDD